MKTETRERNSRRGSALVTVMIVVVTMSALLYTAAQVASQTAFMNKKLADRIRAMAIAEAGANEAYALIKTDWDARLNPANFPLTEYGGGAYDVTVTISPTDTNIAVICSTGTCGISALGVVLNARDYGAVDPGGGGGGGPPPPPQGGLGAGADAFDYAIVSGGNMTFVGNMTMNVGSNGWFHANGLVSGNGQQTINGNVSSSTSLTFPHINGVGNAPTVSGDIDTPITGEVAPVIIPDIDLTPYYNEALANGQVFTTATKSLSGTVTPPGGIMWVNGNISFGGGTFNGCFIATGNISTGTGNTTFTFNPVASYPLLVCRDGNMTWQGGNKSVVNFDGLIYVKTGIFDKKGNGDVYGKGSIIAAGGFSKNGGWGGMLYEDSTPIAPGDEVPPEGGGGGEPPTPVPDVDVSAWQR